MYECEIVIANQNKIYPTVSINLCFYGYETTMLLTPVLHQQTINTCDLSVVSGFELAVS